MIVVIVGIDWKTIWDTYLRGALFGFITPSTTRAYGRYVELLNVNDKQKSLRGHPHRTPDLGNSGLGNSDQLMEKQEHTNIDFIWISWSCRFKKS